MPRDHARVKLSIWGDDDFRALSPAAQHLYFVLMTSPEMNYAGVTDWRPNRIAKRAGAWSAPAVEIAAQELSEQLYVVIDIETEEVLLRSLIRHDGLLEQPNLAVAVRKAWAAVASLVLRGVVVHELDRLRKDKPDLKGWDKVAELLDKPSVDPSSHPSFRPSDDPSIDPSGWRSIDPSLGATPNPSDDPSPIPLPSSLLPTPSSQLQRTEDQDLGENVAETLQATGASNPPDEAQCSKHPNGNPTDEPCVGCRRVRDQRDRSADHEAERRAAELGAARAQCPDCGGDGKVLDAEGRPTSKRCTHPNAGAAP